MGPSTTNTLLIRTDASTQIGSGHLMRCLALSQAWQKWGGQSVFVSVCDTESLRRRVQATGAQFVPLQAAHPAASDLQNTLSTARDFRPHWLVLDGYHFDSDYQKALREAGFRLMVIDDTCHLNRYHADILLNQNVTAAKFSYRCEGSTTLLLGTRFVLLRPEFRSIPLRPRVFDGSGNRVLVTLGGADPCNASLKVVEALEDITAGNLALRIVVGPSNSHTKTLSSKISSLKGSTEVLVNPPDMSELMTWADLAVSAAGSTCWELAFMGTPAVVIVTAQNQLGIAEELSRLGVAVNMGWAEQVVAPALAATIAELLSAGSRRTQMSLLGQRLVDGDGVDRVIMHLTGQSIRLRSVREEDRMILWTWANEPAVREESFSSPPIDWDEHLEWFSAKLRDPGCLFLMAVDKEDNPVGQVRFDVCEQKPGEATISVSVASQCRNQGYGTKIIASASQRLWDETPTRAIHAYVKADNTASVVAFSKAGYCHELLTRVQGQQAVVLTLWKEAKA